MNIIRTYKMIIKERKQMMLVTCGLASCIQKAPEIFTSNESQNIGFIKPKNRIGLPLKKDTSETFLVQPSSGHRKIEELSLS